MTMPKMKIKKGDEVVILAGKDKGKQGKVIAAMPRADRVVVEGVNVMTHHTKPGRGSAGGLEKKEAAIHISNVALRDPKSGKATRVGYKTDDKGVKTRIAKRSGEVI